MSDGQSQPRDDMRDAAKMRRATLLDRKREKVMALSVELTEVRAQREELLLKERELLDALDLILQGAVDGLP